MVSTYKLNMLYIKMLPLKFNKIYVFPLIGSCKIDGIKFTPKIEITAPKKHLIKKSRCHLPTEGPGRVPSMHRRGSGREPGGGQWGWTLRGPNHHSVDMEGVFWGETTDTCSLTKYTESYWYILSGDSIIAYKFPISPVVT